jgi:hypothetical protein
MSTLFGDQAPSPPHPELSPDAHRDLVIAVQRALASHWDDDQPRIAVIEREQLATVYVSTTQALEPAARIDIRDAVLAALAPHTAFAPSTSVVFLRRLAP